MAAHYALRTPTPVAALVVSADLLAPQPPGTSVTFTATAVGGTPPYAFKWWVLDAGGWTLARDWSSEASYTWTPTAADPSGRVTVWARSAGNTEDAPEKSANLSYPIQAAVAHLLSPLAGSTADLSQPLTWTAVPGAEAYWLYVGTAPGASDLINSGEIQQTSFDASGLSGDAGVAFLAWDVPEDSSKVAGYSMSINGARTDLGLLPVTSCRYPDGPCHRTPLPPLPPGVHVIDVSAYNRSGESSSNPIVFSEPYRVVYVRLWTRIAGWWGFTDTWFSPAEVAAQFIAPVAGAVNVDTTMPLAWNAIPGAEAYSLTIGYSEGSAELVDAPALGADVTSYPAADLPGLQRLYARLGTRVGGVWRYVDAVFTTGPAPSAP